MSRRIRRVPCCYHPGMSRLNRIVTAAILICAGGLALYAADRQQPDAARYRGWSAYGGNIEQTRYSSLTQIDRTNVGRLVLAWTFDTGEAGDFQTQPTIVDGVLFGYTPTHK